MKLREHLDKIYDALTELKVVSVKQQQILDEHMRRTEIAEESIILLQDTTRIQTNAIQSLSDYVGKQRRTIGSLKKSVSALVIGIILAAVTHFLFK